MKRFWSLSFALALCLSMAFADGRPGSVTWSDGRKIIGAISLSPGKELRIFTDGKQITLQLDQVKDIRFKAEKEEMAEGFYFPNAGQTTQVKTGEVYPTREFQTEITLSDGKVISGHLFTTMIYVETDTNTEKVGLMAKQTGTNGQKLADLAYTTDISFDSGSPSAGSSQIDVTKAGFTEIKQIIALSKPDLGTLPTSQVNGKQAWTVPMGDPKRVLFCLETADGLHVSWPELDADPDVLQAVNTGLKVMQDFYDTRTVIGCFAEDTDVYSLVMMKRAGTTYGYSADRIPWSVVVLRWKYDSDEKKVTLLNRVMLKTGRAEGNSPAPTVFKQGALLLDITTQNPPAKAPTQP